ncbi:hypothetical protein KR093_005703 [Drosophila rubida]|uniref:Uncharacterized protein n=1 Tax=Drosophila rubida TaxID=30044 RepID=A0AAD4K0C0_9MUSC|nr:hypothetical protein KR093_005703 [Drosophila rubida]
MTEYKRAFDFVVRALAAASLLIVMSAIYQQNDDPGSFYLHPRRLMQ